MLSSKDIREKLRHGEAVIGSWLRLPCPDSAEIIARMGYDWAVVDMKHGSFTRSLMTDMFRALERWGALPFARLADAGPAQITAALDAGARGLLYPMVESREQLEEAIAWSLYPGGREFAGGRRSMEYCRANVYGLDFGAQSDEKEGLAHDIVLVAQIEHVDALANLNAIFAHPRLDACLIGPHELAASMGLAGQFEHPDFLGALAFIEIKAREHGVGLGCHVVQPDEKLLRAKLTEGYTFLAYGMDVLFLQQSARHPLLR